VRPIRLGRRLHVGAAAALGLPAAEVLPESGLQARRARVLRVRHRATLRRRKVRSGSAPGAGPLRKNVGQKRKEQTPYWDSWTRRNATAFGRASQRMQGSDAGTLP